MEKKIKKYTQLSLTVVISVLIIFTVVKASTIKITPPTGEPTATFYSLSEIYNFITDNTPATEGSPALDFSSVLEDTGRTLTEVYEALANLIDADQVKLGKTYLGVGGTLVPSGGTATTSDVCPTKTYFGANQTDWNLVTGALTIDDSKVLSGTTYCSTGGTMTNVGQQTITPTTTNTTITAGYHNGTGYCAGDADLVEGKIKSEIDLFGVTGDYPSATYTLPSADATTDLAASGGNISSSNGSVEWWQSDGTRQTATLDFPTLSNVCSSDTSNNSTGTLSITAAYVSVGNTYCGTAGTLLANLFNGSFGAGGFDGGAWGDGGVGDYNNNNERPSDSYDVDNWVACNSGNSYCGLNDSDYNGFKMDPATRIVWSDPCTGAGCDSFESGLAYNDTPTTNYEWCGDTDDPGCSGLSFDDNDNLNDSSVRLSAQELCTSGDHGKSGWYLPHQKMLMQTYIDGCWGNLSGAAAYFWSATTNSSDTGYAWYVTLPSGYTVTDGKSYSQWVRCVRLAGAF